MRLVPIIAATLGPPANRRLAPPRCTSSSTVRRRSGSWPVSAGRTRPTAVSGSRLSSA